MNDGQLDYVGESLDAQRIVGKGATGRFGCKICRGNKATATEVGLAINLLQSKFIHEEMCSNCGEGDY